NGGGMTAEAAAEKPAYIVEAGAAAGGIAPAHMGRRVGLSNPITLDKGGATAQSSLIEGGRITKNPRHEARARSNPTTRRGEGRGVCPKAPLDRYLRDRRGRGKPRID